MRYVRVGMNIQFCVALCALFFASALPATAAFAGLVPCGQGDSYCTVCDLLKLVDQLKNFVFFYLVPVGGTIMVVIAGFYLIFAGQIPGNVQKAKNYLWSVFIGAIIIGFSWLITNTIIQSLAKEDNISRSWISIECKGPVSSPSPTGVPAPTPAQTMPAPPGGGLSESEARRQLEDAGVGWNNLPCAPGQTTGCTNFAGIRQKTLDAIISLRQRCGCTVVVTAGTEGGHEPGTYSHANGYKVDLRLNEKLDSYIRNNFTPIAPRRESDGLLTPQWQDPVMGAIYALEGNHWDVLVK